MKKLMHFMFLSCLRATELIEKKFLFKLSITERLQLKVHKSMCKACSNYEKQNILIEKSISKFAEETQDPADIEKIRDSILSNLNIK